MKIYNIISIIESKLWFIRHALNQHPETSQRLALSFYFEEYCKLMTESDQDIINDIETDVRLIKDMTLAYNPKRAMAHIIENFPIIHKDYIKKDPNS